MDIAVYMRVGMCLVEHIHLVELFCTLASVFQHSAHSGIAVNVGILALDITVCGGRKRQILVYLHKCGIHLSASCTVSTVKNIRLCRLGVTALDQNALHHILNLLD